MYIRVFNNNISMIFRLIVSVTATLNEIYFISCILNIYFLSK